MKHHSFFLLLLSALLVVSVSCGKEKSEGPKPCINDCVRGLPKPLPESEGTMSDLMRKFAEEHRPAPVVESTLKERRAEGQEVYSDTTYVATLADACKNAGGTLVVESLDCECPDAGSGAVYSARSQTCVTPTRDTSCTKPDETFTAALERRGTEDFITSCLSKIQTFEGTVVSIAIPNDRAVRAREVATILDSQPATRPLRGSAPSLSRREGWGSSFVILYGTPVFDERALTTKPYMGDPNDSKFSVSKKAVHVTSAEGLAALFQYEPTTSDSIPVLLALDLFSQENKEILRPLMSAATERAENSNQRTFTPELDGCSQLCTVRTTLKSLPSGQKVWRERVFVWGQVFSDAVILGKNNSSVDARLIFGVDGAISAIEVNTVALNGSLLTQVHRLFDAQGKKLGEEKKNDTSLTPLTSLHSTRGMASLGNDTPVVVCNNFFFTGEGNKVFSDAVLFGPYISNDPFGKGSLFGWDENPDASIGNFLGGYNQEAVSLKEDGFSGFLSVPFQGLTGARLRIIPATSERCKPGSEFLKSALEKTNGKARIVTALTSTFENANDCKARYGRELEDNAHLWVVTSGVSGFPGRNNFRCPQALGPSHNLIVVAGDLPSSDGHSLMPPDTGEDYVDLAVVSYFQPRHAPAAVAHAAASIQASYGAELSNSLIRLSLLLSVDLRKSRSGAWAPYPSRSGGFLNSDRALTAARFIATQLSPEQRANFGATDAKAVIEYLFPDAAEAQYRVNLASERKGLLL